ncbi:MULTISPECIES: hypothetical protein [unclassified Photorhabdus]|uniref:hypothetical protein n=1 Tax=unclassified Photorhabdus TaxID=2620880 RepID=UPI001313F149|nr:MULTISPECIES: hypothetical protein [unclassified Photorhabdus]
MAIFDGMKVIEGGVPEIGSRSTGKIRLLMMDTMIYFLVFRLHIHVPETRGYLSQRQVL